MEKLTRVQATHHRLIWRKMCQGLKEAPSVIRLKDACNNLVPVRYHNNCVLCEVYMTYNYGIADCGKCPLYIDELSCKHWFDTIGGDQKAAEFIRDVKLDVEPKTK